MTGQKLGWLATASIVVGVGLLLYTAYLIWDPGASRAQHQLVTRLQLQWHRHLAPGHAQPIRVPTGQPFAFIRIPRFGPHWRFAIVQGTGLTQLAVGPGHVQGTQLPGQPGNFAVAAHDITAGNAFLHLASLRAGDAILVTTINANYHYRVLSEHVVRYTDVGVLDAVPGHPARRPVHKLITLITCTPVTLAFTPDRVVVIGTLTRISRR
jgi:sortase A